MVALHHVDWIADQKQAQVGVCLTWISRFSHTVEEQLDCCARRGHIGSKSLTNSAYMAHLTRTWRDTYLAPKHSTIARDAWSISFCASPSRRYVRRTAWYQPNKPSIRTQLDSKLSLPHQGCDVTMGNFFWVLLPCHVTTWQNDSCELIDSKFTYILANT